MKREFTIHSVMCGTCNKVMTVTGKIMSCDCGLFPALVMTYDDHGRPDPQLQELIRIEEARR